MHMTTPPQRADAAQSTTCNLSIGILGTGDIVVNLHLPVLLCRDDVQVDWITDGNKARAASVARSFGVASIGLPASLMDIPSVDVLLVAIPFGAREKYYEALRGRPISLYVEKPFACTVQDHIRLASWFKESQIGCGFQRRSSKAVQFFKEFLSKGLLGPIRRVRLGHGARGKLGASRYSGDLNLAGGGILMEAGIHLLDAALYVLEATEILEASGHQLRDCGFDVHTDASLRVSTQQLGEFPLDIIVSGLTNTLSGIEVEYEHASLFFAENNGVLRARARTDTSWYTINSVQSAGETAAQLGYAHWSAFLASVRSGLPNHTTVSDCLLTTNAIERLYGMAEQGA